MPSRKGCLRGGLVDVNCREYDDSRCLSCYPGYYLAKNRCFLPNADCKTFDDTNGGCLSCFPGFTKTNRQCLVMAKKKNCLSYDSRGDCSRC